MSIQCFGMIIYAFFHEYVSVNEWIPVWGFQITIHRKKETKMAAFS